MTMFVKLAGELPPFEKAFFRNLVTSVFMTGVMLKKHISFIPEKKNVPDLLGRSLFGALGIICNFYAIDRMNLPDANMLNKMSPFFAVIFSIFLLKEIPTIVQILGVIVAFAGSLFIIKPGFSGVQILPAIMGLLGGIGAGAAYTFVRRLGKKGEDSQRIIFFFSVFSCVLYAPMIIFEHSPMTVKQLLCLLGAGVGACVGQIGITRAYMFAPAKEISVYDYAQVIFAAIIGYVVFGELPDVWSIIGYVLICGAGVGMYIYNNRKDKSANKKESDGQ